MKTILLLRHAKSSWGDPGLDDFDRPLNSRGEKDAPRMGEVLASFDQVPDQILASPAKRAKQTAEAIAKACGYKKSIQWEESFYGGDSEDLITALQNLPRSIERPLLVGHNPTMEETVADLIMPRQEGWYEQFSIQMPTAALACLAVDIMEWSALEPGEAVLQWFLIPKLVKAIQM